MRVMCIFDLPVNTNQEKKSYLSFRKNLLREGFIMVQYSVYMRVCPNRDFANRLYKRIERYAPYNGHIRLFMITEKQYDDMKILIGKKGNTEEIIGKERFIVL